MRKVVIVVLILSLVLVGCPTPDWDNNTANIPDLGMMNATEDQFSHTDPNDTLEGAVSGPVISDSTSPTSAVPDSSENSTDETQSPQQATETPTTPTEPTEETKPT